MIWRSTGVLMSISLVRKYVRRFFMNVRKRRVTGVIVRVDGPLQWGGRIVMTLSLDTSRRDLRISRDRMYEHLASTMMEYVGYSCGSGCSTEDGGYAIDSMYCCTSLSLCMRPIQCKTKTAHAMSAASSTHRAHILRLAEESVDDPDICRLYKTATSTFAAAHTTCEYRWVVKCN